MNRSSRAWRLLAGLLLLAAIFVAVRPALTSASPASDPSARQQPDVIASSRNDQSPSLAALAAQQPTLLASERMSELPAFTLPRLDGVTGSAPSGGDGALQSAQGGGTMPAPLQNFEGIPNVNGVLPPDTNGDVGPNHYVQMVNLSYAVWDKEGTLLLGPLPGNALWDGFGGPCEQTNDGDPIVLYDELADRWMLSQFALPSFPNGPFYMCLAVSATADPTGSYYRYEFATSDTQMDDYPKLGVWPDGYYMSVNQFDSTAGLDFAGVGAGVFEREKMLVGLPARLIYFDNSAWGYTFGGVLPADMEGPPPADGSPNYFVGFNDDAWEDYPTDRLHVWEFVTDWADPLNSTYGDPTAAFPGFPNYDLETDAFDSNMCGYARNCIPQPGTASRLDAISDRVMFRLAYRNFGTHEAMVTNHSVDVGGDHAGVRWYEMRKVGADDWGIHQQGSYAPDSDHRWMGSAALDNDGNMALGYSVSSGTTFPSIRYAGRLVGDPLNTLGQAEATLIAGSGSQTHSAARWGDYSSMSVDPVDGCTFWFTSEYYETTSTAGWQTRIGSFRFPSCVAAEKGALTGTVTDSSNGNPIAGALVEASPNLTQTYSTATDATGVYSLLLPSGTYSVTGSAFGYSSETVAGVVVATGVTTTQDLQLDPLPAILLSGTVTDADTGWPLYASLDIVGYQGGTIWTDPVTGFYSVTVPGNLELQVTVDAWEEGYESLTTNIGPYNADATQNFQLQADLAACTAPGYSLFQDLLYESFDGPTAPAGWTVVNNGGDAVWRFDDPAGRGNLTGGAGNFAIADSDFAGSGSFMDTELRTPPLDLTATSTHSLTFKTDYNDYSSEIADVDISTNGAAGPWTNLWQKTTDFRGPQTVTLDLSAYSTETNVMIRFHYHNADWEWWWQVDDVVVGAEPTCVVPDGGLVVGQVYDANTGEALPGATVESDAGGIELTMMTPDPSVEDGFYSMYVPQGSHVLTASIMGLYGADSATVVVPSGDTVEQNFYLAAALLEATPNTLESVQLVDSRRQYSITVSNNGSLAADFSMREIDALPIPIVQPPFGPFDPTGRHLGPKNMAFYSLSGVAYYLEPPTDVAILAGGDVINKWSTGLTLPWGVGYDLDEDTVWVGNLAAGGGDDMNYEFLPDGTPTGDTIDTAPWVGSFAADMAYDPITRSLWQVNVSGDNCIYQMDPATNTATGSTICPAFGTSQRGLAFDPNTDTFYAGSWNDSLLHQFTREGAILRSVDIGLAISGLAYNPDSRRLYVLANANAGLDVYALDVDNNFAVVGGFNVPGIEDFDQAGLAMSCDGHLWTANQNSGEIFEIDSGEAGACEWMDVPWLSLSSEGGTLAAGQSTEVIVTFDSTGMMPGEYAAQIAFGHITPYAPSRIEALMVVVGDPVIELEKTVGTAAGACATSDAITVPTGTDVYYCYTITNTSQITLPLHTLDDSELGTLFTDLAYDLGPGMSVSTVDAGLTISATINTTTVNTATWTVSDQTGFSSSAMDTATVTIEDPTAITVSTLVGAQSAAPTRWLALAGLALAAAGFIAHRRRRS